MKCIGNAVHPLPWERAVLSGAWELSKLTSPLREGGWQKHKGPALSLGERVVRQPTDSEPSEGPLHTPSRSFAAGDFENPQPPSLGPAAKSAA